jgi:hypothetical protein
MTRRNSPQLVRTLDDLSQLGEVVVDKRLGQRSAAKKNRRNRHYEKQFIRNAISHRAPDRDDPMTDDAHAHQDDPP